MKQMISLTTLSTTLCLSRNAARRIAARFAAVLLAAVFAAVLLDGVPARATNYYWITNTPNDYSNAAVWSPTGPPDGTSAVAYTTNDAQITYSAADNYTLEQLQLGVLSDNPGGTVTMNGGTLTITNAGQGGLVLGGTMALNGGSRTAVGTTGTFILNGGTLNVIRGQSTFYQDDVELGVATSASTAGSCTGTLTVNGGLLNNICNMQVGYFGHGILNLTGGAIIEDSGLLIIGDGQGANTLADGRLNLSGGTLYILRNQGHDPSGSGPSGLVINKNCTNGTVNISGGTLFCSQVETGYGKYSGGPTENWNVSGGDIYVGFAGVNNINSGGNHTVQVNISGGTFHTVDLVEQTTTDLALTGNTNTAILSDGTNWTWNANMPVNLTNSSFQVVEPSGTYTGPGYVTFAPEAGRTITLNNVWSGVGGMTMNGPGVLVLSGKNNFSGPLTLNNGVLAINAAQNDGGGLTINGGALAMVSGSLADSTIDFPSSSMLVFTNSGTLAFTNVITGAGSVNVEGAGTASVGSNLQNTGPIYVDNGMLAVNGTIQDSSGIINDGGALWAQGTISSPIEIGTNGNLDLGTGVSLPGTLNASNVTMNGAWHVKINAATTPGGGTNDLLVTTNLALGTNSVLTVTPLQSLAQGSTYVIAKYSGTLTGTFATVNTTSRDTFSVDYSTPGQIRLMVDSVPPPASLDWAATNGQPNINWDVATSTNWINTSTLQAALFYQQDAVNFNSAPGTTNRVSITGTVSPSTMTVSGSFPYIFSGTGAISGGGDINFDGTGVSGIYTTGNSFTGPVNINSGILQLGTGGSSWLGTTNGATYVNGGTLDLNGHQIGAEPLVLSGNGAGGTNGAVNNTSSVFPGVGTGPWDVTLAGNTTIAASGMRWDIGSGSLNGYFHGNGYNLTKIGANPIFIYNIVGDLGVSNIDLQEGELGFQYTISLGTNGTLTAEPGTTVRLYALTANAVLSKPMILDNATLSSGGSAGTSNSYVGPITLVTSTNFINTGSGAAKPLTLSGALGGTGGFDLSGSGPLYLEAASTYTGPTYIESGASIILGPSGSIGGSSLIDVGPGANAASALLDATQSGLTLNSGQTLVGFGSVAGDVTANGGTIEPGTTLVAGTLTFSNNLTLNGATNVIKLDGDPGTVGQGVNDLISVAGGLTLNGTSTIVIKPLGVLSSSSPYILCEYNGTLTGGAGNLQVVCTNPRYNVSLVDPATTPGYIEVNISGNPAPLVWKGEDASAPNLWDHSTTNWVNLNTASPDNYFNGDTAIFNDSAATKSVNVAVTVLGGSMIMSNNASAYTFTGGGLLEPSLDMEGTGTTTLAVSNAPAFSAITANSGTLVFDVQGVSMYSNNAAISDNGYGLGTIVKAGTNTLRLHADNSLFNGILRVTDGVLQYSNSVSLGNAYAQPVYVTNTGTLDLNGRNTGAKSIIISGAGFNGEGAVVNNGSVLSKQGVSYLTLAGNATINGGPSNGSRWDVANGTLTGNGFNLTKIGAGVDFLLDDGDTGLGNIDVAAGRLGFQGNTTMGVATNTVTVQPNALLSFYKVTNTALPYNGEDKVMVLNGGNGNPTNGYAMVDCGGASNNFDGPVTLVGTNNAFSLRSDLHLWNGISGSGGFIAGMNIGPGNGTLYVDGTNSYTGPTIIYNGHAIVLGANSSVNDSSLIRVDRTATLDASAPGSLDLGAGHRLMGSGTVIAGNVTLGNGATLAPGFPDTNIYTLTVNGNLTLEAGSTNIVVVNKNLSGTNDMVAGLGAVTLGGTLVITNTGSPLAGGDAIKLFSANNYSGSFSSIIPATPGPGLTWDTSQLPTNGTLLVAGTGISQTPTNIVISVSGGQLSLSWPTNYTGWTLQAQTNSLGVGLSTNWVDVSGSAATNHITVPINPANGTVFYRMSLQP